MVDIIDSFSGKYECFSNFSAHPVGPYATSEHAFQAKKASNKRDHDYVASAAGPASAKWRGRQIELRADWDEVKDNEMLHVVFDKFLQHRDIADTLIGTGDAILIEGNYHRDDYWGKVRNEKGDWVGKNVLGITLMVVRKTLVEMRAKEGE
jgi:ribA/ribD-fused uncharacterized protein